jgi:hypothetical protein
VKKVKEDEEAAAPQIRIKSIDTDIYEDDDDT